MNSRWLSFLVDKTEKTCLTGEIAIGMKVMVTRNVEMDLNMTNGARGEIVGIMLHQNEPDNPLQPVILITGVHIAFASLEEGAMPVEPRTISMKLQVEEAGSGKCRTGKRCQLTITAYAFIDYRAHG
jgi:hypothetical protein